MTDISQKLFEPAFILVPFTSAYHKKYHASHLAKVLKKPQRTVLRRLEDLRKNNLLDYNSEGRNKYYYLNLSKASSFTLLVMLESYKELEFISKHQDISLLLAELSKHSSIILFGSYAKNLQKKESDIDLVIIGRKSKKTEKIIKKYPFEVNAHYLSLNLFKKQLWAGNHLALEIAKDHIFFGEKEAIIKILIDYYKRGKISIGN
jgi:predicted nucleotidyltransferase